jgi:hypothetical protein
MAEAALDTTVLQRANVELTPNREAASRLARRISLLRRISNGDLCVLISNRLAVEYSHQLRVIRNDVLKAFLELVTRPDGTHVVFNWKTPWSGADRSRARGCRYPQEDDHVLRTAIRGEPTVIYTEEDRMLRANDCVYRQFSVHILMP